MQKLTYLTASLFCLALSLQAQNPTKASADTRSQADIRSMVQMTEVGCMRTLLLLDPQAAKFEKLIEQRLTEVDFRVFPAAKLVEKRLSPAELRKAGVEEKADLVLFASLAPRLKNSLGEFQIFEAEASVQVLSPITGELLVSQSERAQGERNVDHIQAERSASEKALDAALQAAINRGLDKVQKLIVHTATLSGVKDHDDLLLIINYVQGMDGIYHVREISYDRGKHIGTLEIIGSPRAETDWRAFLERMPNRKFSVEKFTFILNPDLHRQKHYPSWYRTTIR